MNLESCIDTEYNIENGIYGSIFYAIFVEIYNKI